MSNVIFKIYQANEGEWGNDIRVRFNRNATINGETIPVEELEGDDRFHIIVELDTGEEDSDETPIYREVERFVASRKQLRDGYGNSQYIEDVVNGRSMYIVIEDQVDVDRDMQWTTDSIVVDLDGGTDDSGSITDGKFIEAWEEFSNSAEIDVRFLINGGFTGDAIRHKMIQVAERRGDQIAILDTPQPSSQSTGGRVTDMVDDRKTLGANTNRAALYGGWLKVYNEFVARNENIPCSADVAQAMVNTIQNFGWWEAPAGLRRGVVSNALGTDTIMDEGQRDILYANGVNPVTTMMGNAAIIWGQKTLQRAHSAMNRVNVVLLIIYINMRMKEALQPFVFEANTEQTRADINYILSSFLGDIQSNGGLYEFAVDTGPGINTPQVIDSNQLLVDVYVKPTRTAEFIKLNTIITPSGVSLG